MDEHNTAGERLRSLRKARGLTQEGVAELIGCVPSMVSMLENGERTPTGKLAIQIESKLGIAASDWWREAPRCA